MVTRYIYAISVCLATLTVTAAPALARTPLYYAHITSVQNRVRMLPRTARSRPAKIADLLMWGDGISTARRSRADLRFNDGSRVRFGQHVLFRFQPGTRRINLANGTVLLLIPPNRGRTRVYTPNAVAGIQGSALFVRYDAGKNHTIVGALTDSGIQVSRPDGSQPQTLAAGQIIVVAGDQVQPPSEFDLKTFYKTSPIAQGFRLDQANVPNADPNLAQVREETLAGLAAQRSFTAVEQATTLNPDFVRLSTVANAGVFDRQQQLMNPQVLQTETPAFIKPLPSTGIATPPVGTTSPQAIKNPALINQPQTAPTGVETTSDRPTVINPPQTVIQPSTPSITTSPSGSGTTQITPTVMTESINQSIMTSPSPSGVSEKVDSAGSMVITQPQAVPQPDISSTLTTTTPSVSDVTQTVPTVKTESINQSITTSPSASGVSENVNSASPMVKTQPQPVPQPDISSTLTTTPSMSDANQTAPNVVTESINRSSIGVPVVPDDVRRPLTGEQPPTTVQTPEPSNMPTFTVVDSPDNTSTPISGEVKFGNQ